MLCRCLGLLLALLGLGSGIAAAAPVLVDTDWVAKRLTEPTVILIDTSAADQYQRFHLPGAVHIPYEALLKRTPRVPYPLRQDDDVLYRLLGQHGVQPSHHVVIYDDVGGLNAGRLFFELERIGHPKVSVLDGGLVAWILEGRRVVNTPATRMPVTYRPTAGGRANEATLEEMLSPKGDATPVLLDVRTPEEYIGDPRQPRTGHIPGAHHWPWEQAVDVLGGYTRAQSASLRESLARAGVREASTPIIAYCRSGHRAAQTYLALRSLGYENVKLYPASMNEYAANPTAPLVRGTAPGAPSATAP